MELIGVLLIGAVFAGKSADEGVDFWVRQQVHRSGTTGSESAFRAYSVGFIIIAIV